MTKKYVLNWKNGKIEISSLGCKMQPTFFLGEKKIKPLHSAGWINDKSKDFDELPGILKNLSGEFPCVPFGINSPIEEIAEEWKESYSEEPYVVNEAHGFSANKDWELLDLKEHEATFKIRYPEIDNIDYLIRSIRINNVEQHKVSCSLEIFVKKDCELPIGLHPMIRIPNKYNKIKILPGDFKFGLTYPGILLKNKTLGAIGEIFTNLDKVKGFSNEYIDLSNPPFEGNFEDLFQLCGINGNMKVRNYEENYELNYNWDPEIFSSVLMWVSNKGREEYPWNNNHLTVGLEPISSAFGLSTHVSNNLNNPIAKKSVSTSVKLYKNQPLKTEYSFSVEKI